MTQALWLRLLAWNMEVIRDKDLMMISEGDVFITTSNIINPLLADFRAWIYWAEPGLYGGQTFPMSFTTLHKRDWARLLKRQTVCEKVLAKFPEETKGDQSQTRVSSQLTNHSSDYWRLD